jgi:hypothetical protein
MHLLEEHLAGVVNETDAAKVDTKLRSGSGGIEFTPALLQGSDAWTGEATFHSEEELAATILGGDSKHM